MLDARHGPRLPPELTDTVIDSLQDDRASLINCSLAGRELVARTRRYLFKWIYICLWMDSAEARLIELRRLMNLNPSLRRHAEYIRVIGGQTESQAWRALAPDALQITPAVFPSLVTLYLAELSLPSMEHLVALALSLPSLEQLVCDQVSYADPTREDRPPDEAARWYSHPLTLTAPSYTPPRLKMLRFVGAFSVDEPTLGTATNIVTCLMDAQLHLHLEALEAYALDTLWPDDSPSWLPMVHACAPNLRELVIEFNGMENNAAGAVPDFIDALRALPRVELLGIRYEALWDDANDPLVTTFLPALVGLVRASPTPFPALKRFQFEYILNDPPDGPLPYPPGTDKAIVELLDGLVGTHAVSGGEDARRRYPHLGGFEFRVEVADVERDEHFEELMRLQGELTQRSTAAGVELELRYGAVGTDRGEALQES